MDENSTYTNALQLRSDTTVVFESAIMAFIMLQGIIGNTLVITVTVKNTKLHTIANYLILNLAVSDMFMVCIAMPVSLYVLAESEWPFGDVLCLCHSFAILWFGIVCLFTLAIISLNRFYYICRFANYSKVFSLRNVKILITFVWILSAVMSSSCLVRLWSEVEFLPSYAACMPNFRTSSVVFSVCLLVIAILMPNCVMFISYVRIFLTVRKSKRNIDNFSVNKGSSATTTEQDQLQRANFTASFSENQKSLAKWTPTLFKRAPRQGEQTHSQRLQYPADHAPEPSFSGANHFQAAHCSSCDLQNTLNQPHSSNADPPEVISLQQLATRRPALVTSSGKTNTWVSAFTQMVERRRANRQKEEMKLTRTLSIVFLVYNICWMPMVATSMLQIYQKPVSHEGVLASVIFMYLSSALNPYIYGLGNRQYRDAIRQTCKCQTLDHQPPVLEAFRERQGHLVKWWRTVDRLRVNRQAPSSSCVTPDRTTGDQRLEMNLANALRLIAQRNVDFVTASKVGSTSKNSDISIKA
ncbi:5-hydroxytryptamine receptor 1D-like [Ptychodera flava]|uniref:5-hydroxytryptamine receptor 1D-like n=1 Tax=Ptychodera flava TaxID=63121 RepID=UPI00396A03AD